MMKDFLKKLGKQQENDDLDTGYDSDYYGGAYNRSQPADSRRETEDFDERYDRDAYGERVARDEYARGYEEEDVGYYRENYYADEKPARQPEPEKATPANAGTLYYTPVTYKDCREAIVSGLAESHVVVVNVKNLDAADTVRLFDYIMGAVLALDADMTRLNPTTLLLAPKDVEVTEDDLRSLFAPKAPVETEEEEAYEEAYADAYADEYDEY